MKLSIFAVIFLTLISFDSGATQRQAPECFQFEKQNNPEAEPLDQMTGVTRFEIWCYQKRTVNNRRYLLIFNADQKELRNELSSVIGLDHRGTAQFESVGNWFRGRVSYSGLPDLALNPFVAPADLEDARTRGAPVYSALAERLDRQGEALDQLFENHLFLASQSKSDGIQEGEFSASVPEKMKPWNGFWWSHAGVPLASGPSSPLGIYDAYLNARKTSGSRAVAWEMGHHSDTVAAWGGHCNGWAASSVLFDEPTQTLVDPRTHRVISPYAQKGMLAEASYCVNDAFYGKRYNGRSGDDLLDLYPDLFHKLLLYYIKADGRPIAMDYVRDAEIDNHVISGYHFSIQKVAPKLFHVNADLTVHGYDIHQEDSLGKAATYSRKYSYTLATNDDGSIQSGKWDDTSDNPDFFWVPLSPSPGCGGKNPSVDPEVVEKMIETLPRAKPSQLVFEKQVHLKLGPQEQVAILDHELLGDHFKVTYNLRSMSGPAATLITSGDNRYPITDGFKYSDFSTLKLGEQKIAFEQLSGIDSMAVVNQDASQSVTIDLTIHQLEYMGE